MTSRSGHRHRLASRQVLRSLAGEVEAEVRLGDPLLVPDLAGWRVDVEPAFVEENPIVEVYALDRGRYRVAVSVRGNDPVVLPPFGALIPLGTWWSTHPPHSPAPEQEP